MAAADRFAGPLAAAWLGASGPALARVLAPPEASLPVPPASERAVWAHPHPATLRHLRARAERDLGTAWPTPLASQYARYFRDGDRDAYEQRVFARQARLTRAAVLAAATLDGTWLDEVVDGVTLLCEQSSWCWPAHDDTRSVHGAVLPTVTDPYLDLGAGEVAAQLAWIDHLLGGPLDTHAPGLRARIRHEVDGRVLRPFAARRDWHWLGLDGDVHNWSAWIHGNVLVAGLRLLDDLDDRPRRAALVELVVEGLDRYVASLPADGAIDEGYGYWWNGACRAHEALDLLAQATGGALDGVPGEALCHTVAFPHRMHLGGDWYLNHADGSARPATDTQPWHALHRAARRVGDRDAQAHAAAHRRPDAPVANEEQGLGRLLRALTDPEWTATGPEWTAAGPAAPPLPRDVWFPSTQVLLARRAAGSPAGLTLAVKGGHNGEHHNHNDVGSVVVALDGVPVLVDAGRPTYTARTFGRDRYAIWTMRSDWHNVPHVRDTAQAPGRGYAARHVVATVDDAVAELSLDIADAYPRTDLRSWRRTARFERHRGRIVITDAWQLDPDAAPASTRLHLLVAGDVQLGPGRATIAALDGAGHLAVSWRPASAPGSSTARVLDDPMLAAVWGERLTRIAIDVTALGPTGALVLTVEETHPHDALSEVPDDPGRQ
ncbi:heparinase II/III family protein [Micromonospora sp. WMMD1082]|uniref:heparinase II/III domain-containing protein n=1 Tax=Micromonospora sp. WMMD1082 TaxID=3016104 RepID=UPI002416757B|nr:heparinase II/III family protein [Micromonospora sp. WMMD1082]MDG4797093.1 heparinase II/III family protein [Micromonospora sp. WMMD1082]